MNQDTTVFKPQKDESKRVKEIMEQVVAALKDKGYEPNYWVYIIGRSYIYNI